MQFRFRYSASAVAAAIVIAMSQGSAIAENLSGRVVDPQGKAVAGASIRLFQRATGEMRTVVSSPDGGYEFRGIAEGDYLVEAEASSAALTASRQLSVRGDQKTDLELSISGKPTEILVTAAAAAQSVEEVAKAIDVVDSEQIALRDDISITEAIRTLPGLRVQTLEGPGSFTAIKTRGLRNQDTAVLIDGLRFRDAASPQEDATSFLQDMTVGDTERIEFLRGSGSSLYGSNALGGVINISSRPGGGPTHGEFRLEGGGLGMIRSVLGIGGGLGSRFAYSGNMTHINVTKGVRDGNPYRNNATQGSAKYNFTPRISVGGRLWYSNNYIANTLSPTFTSSMVAGIPSPGIVPAVALPTDQLALFEKGLPYNAGNATFIPNQVDPDNRLLGSFLNGSVNFQHELSRDTSYRVTYQGVSTKRTYLDGPAGPGFQPNFNGSYRGRTDSAQARMDQRVGAHNAVTFGYEFENERYLSFDDRATMSNSIGIQQRSNAVYVQDQIGLLQSRLQLTVAGRVQTFSLDSPTFSGATTPYSSVPAVDPPAAHVGDGAIAYFFQHTRTKVRAHVGNSFRAPSPYERFGGSTGAFASYYGDPRLSPERAISVDGGIDQSLMGSKVQVSATVFYTKLQQTILFAGTLPAGDPFNRFFGYANGGGGIARGVEFSGRVTPSAQTTLQASYTYTNSDSNAPTIAAAGYHQTLGVSAHSFSLSATQRVGRRISFAFDISALSDYVSPVFSSITFGTRYFMFNGPTRADVAVHYDLPVLGDRTLDLYGKVENLLNQEPYENGFLGPRAWATVGLRLKF
jgi:vitamin B12 transporter